MSQLPFRQQLETHNQPEEVRQRLAAGQYSQPQAGIAQEYLDSIDRKDAALAAARTEARADINLSISRKALSTSRWALIIAISAIMLSAIVNSAHIASFVTRLIN